LYYYPLLYESFLGDTTFAIQRVLRFQSMFTILAFELIYRSTNFPLNMGIILESMHYSIS